VVELPHYSPHGRKDELLHTALAAGQHVSGFLADLASLTNTLTAFPSVTASCADRSQLMEGERAELQQLQVLVDTQSRASAGATSSSFFGEEVRAGATGAMSGDDAIEVTEAAGGSVGSEGGDDTRAAKKRSLEEEDEEDDDCSLMPVRELRNQVKGKCN
jgi:hypothetical protein